MARNPGNQAVGSLFLSKALEYIGVNRDVVKKRRETYLQIEAVENLEANLTFHFFGSQSEGSTTPGMNADTDCLISDDDVNVMVEWKDWKAGMDNLLMVKEVTTPRQHYLLQLIRGDSPEPDRYNGQEYCVPGRDGRVFQSNKMWQNIMRSLCGKDFVCSGPSASFSKQLDFVTAYKCKLPSEVKHWLHRHRHGHWPTPKMIQDAAECSCFLVPDGHFDSINEVFEWRLSPNQIERILVFSFTILQLKCYVVLKMLKNHFNEHFLSIHSKLTSFHCKTVMFFTIEKIPPADWKEERLTTCIIHCLQTLKMFLLKGFCPHYILPEVDLFEGKITRQDQRLLAKKIQECLNGDLLILYDLQIDSLGQRLLNPTSDMLESRSTLCRSINNNLALALVKRVSQVCFKITNTEFNPKPLRQLTITLALPEDDDIIKTLSRYERRVLSTFRPHIFSFLASVASSYYMEHEIPLRAEIFHLYEHSLDTDVTSSRLKVASMLYCSGDLRRAADVLNEVERRYDDTVHTVCGCGITGKDEEPPELLSESEWTDWNDDTIRHKVAFCVRFTRFEMYCVPPILLYEMNRAMNDEVEQRSTGEWFWMDKAVVDPLPYLFYLQYLTYGGLRNQPRQKIALKNLENCFESNIIMSELHHFGTTANLLGHCWEMEGNINKALRWYTISIRILPRNNAANLHIRRLICNTI